MKRKIRRAGRQSRLFDIEGVPTTGHSRIARSTQRMGDMATKDMETAARRTLLRPRNFREIRVLSPGRRRFVFHDRRIITSVRRRKVEFGAAQDAVTLTPQSPTNGHAGGFLKASSTLFCCGTKLVFILGRPPQQKRTL